MPVPLTILASVQNKDVKYVALVPSTGKHNKYLTVQRVLMWLAVPLTSACSTRQRGKSLGRSKPATNS
jgi:hypothetical protein